jgi:hypothetical protein
MGWQDAPLANSSKKPAWQDAPLANAPVAADDPGAGKGWAETGAEWRSLPERMLPGVRPAAIAAGASAGAMMSLPAAPALGPLAPLAPVVGGALGAGAASAGYDNISDLLTQIIPGFKPLPDATAGGADAIAGRAADEAAFDAAFTAGAGILGFPVKHFISPLVGKVFGVRNQAAITAGEVARRHGVDLGAVDVGNQAPRIMAKVLGVFPVTGGPLRTARDAKEAQLQAAVRYTLNRVAPTASISQEMGVDLMKAAQQADKQFTDAAAVLYDKFRQGAAGAGAVIPTSEAKTVIQKWVADFEAGQIPIGDGVLKGGVNEAFEQFLKDTLAMPEKVTWAQYERLQNQFESFIDKLNPDGFTVKRVAQIKQGMERDLNAIADPTLKKMKEEADTFFANGILVFQTPTAQKFGRADKNIFKAGPDKPGTINPDELMKPVFNADSPIALKQLRALVGDDAFRRASRTHMQNSFEQAWKKEVRHGDEVSVFDPEAMARSIGLGAGQKDKRAALEEMLRGSGVKVQDVEDLLTRIRITKQADPSAFVSRRVTLGGVAALTALGGAGAAAVGGPVAAAGSPLVTALMTWGAYNFSKLLASPQALKAFTRSFQPEVNDVTRRAVYFRFLREFGDVREQQ